MTDMLSDKNYVSRPASTICASRAGICRYVMYRHKRDDVHPYP